MELGKLEKVDLRLVWKNEESDFSQWLAKDENLSRLSDELGIGLKLIEKEADVGDFSVDILAQDEDGNKVIIENQLENSNHDHLGKLITYAAGRDAKKIIWIVKELRDEHKQAIDWLNLHTDGDTQFFAVKMEVWKIGQSLPAPKFQMLSTPNTWTKAIRAPGVSGEPTETKLQQLDFWKKFIEYAKGRGTKLRLSSPRPQHWYNIRIGSSKAQISLTVNTQENSIGCELYIPEDKPLFNALSQAKQTIEQELGEKPEWMPLPQRKASRIRSSMKADLRDESKLTTYFQWLTERAEKYQLVFQKQIKQAQLG